MKKGQTMSSRRRINPQRYAEFGCEVDSQERTDEYIFLIKSVDAVKKILIKSSFGHKYHRYN